MTRENRQVLLLSLGAMAFVIVAGVIIAIASPKQADTNATRPAARTSATATAEPIDAADEGLRSVNMMFVGEANGVDVTMSIGGKISQHADKAVPVDITVDMPSGTRIYWSGQSQSGYGDITCRISVDGVVLDETTSTGGYVIATCKATVP